jgi:hypothetical protein
MDSPFVNTSPVRGGRDRVAMPEGPEFISLLACVLRTLSSPCRRGARFCLTGKALTPLIRRQFRNNVRYGIGTYGLWLHRRPLCFLCRALLDFGEQGIG